VHIDSSLNSQPLGAYHVYSLTMNLNHQQGDLGAVFTQVTTALTWAHNLLKEMNTHAILCCLVKSLNYVAYGHILIKRVTEEVKRMLTVVNVSRVFTQPLTLVLPHFIEAARTLLLNKFYKMLTNWLLNNKAKIIVTVSYLKDIVKVWWL